MTQTPIDARPVDGPRRGGGRLWIAGMAASAAVLAGMLSGGDGAHAREVRAQAASYLGVPVTIEEAPWAASLTLLDENGKPQPRGRYGYRSVCSASVIGPRLVLTASHCVDDYDLSRAGVRVGTVNLLASPGRVIPIKRAWAAMLRDGLRPERDLALVETKADLGVPALPLATERPQPGETVSSFGYGNDEEVNNFEVRRPLLRRLDSVVQPDCMIFASPDAICTTTSNGGAVGSGDSGGPLVVVRNGSPMLVGNASAGTNDRRVMVYANAVALKDFIAAPPAEALVPMAVKPVKIAGAVKPGGRVTCAGRMAPAPKKVRYSWHIGSRSVGPVKRDIRDPRTGRVIPYREVRPPFSHKRSITIPRDAGGEPIVCTVRVKSGPFFLVTLAARELTISRR